MAAHAPTSAGPPARHLRIALLSTLLDASWTAPPHGSATAPLSSASAPLPASQTRAAAVAARRRRVVGLVGRWPLVVVGLASQQRDPSPAAGRHHCRLVVGAEEAAAEREHARQAGTHSAHGKVSWRRRVRSRLGRRRRAAAWHGAAVRCTRPWPCSPAPSRPRPSIAGQILAAAVVDQHPTRSRPELTTCKCISGNGTGLGVCYPGASEGWSRSEGKRFRQF